MLCYDYIIDRRLLGLFRLPLARDSKEPQQPSFYDFFTPIYYFFPGAETGRWLSTGEHIVRDIILHACVSLSLHMYIYIYIYIDICMYLYMCVYICMCIYTHTYKQTSKSVNNTYIYIYIGICRCVHTSLSLSIYIYIYIYVSTIDGLPVGRSGCRSGTTTTTATNDNDNDNHNNKDDNNNDNDNIVTNNIGPDAEVGAHLARRQQGLARPAPEKNTH